MFLAGFAVGVIATLLIIWLWYMYSTPAITGIESDDERQ